MIRPATRADLPVLLAMLREMAEYERLAQHFTATQDALAAALFADAPLAHAVLAEADGRAVGFAIWTFSFHTFRCQRVLFVEDVFVCANARATGFGYALFQFMAREAVTRGCARMDWHVLDWNDLALRFYDRLGATAPRVGWVARQLAGEALTRLAGAATPAPRSSGSG